MPRLHALNLNVYSIIVEIIGVDYNGDFFPLFPLRAVANDATGVKFTSQIFHMSY